jgi:hypothetical protein
MKLIKENTIYILSFPLFILGNLVLYNIFRLMWSMNISTTFLGSYCKVGGLSESYMNMIYLLVIVKLCIYGLWTYFLIKKWNSKSAGYLLFCFFVFEFLNLLFLLLYANNIIGSTIIGYFVSNRTINTLALNNDIVLYIYSAILFTLFYFYVLKNLLKFRLTQYMLSIASLVVFILIHFILIANNLGCWQAISRFFS